MVGGEGGRGGGRRSPACRHERRDDSDHDRGSGGYDCRLRCDARAQGHLNAPNGHAGTTRDLRRPIGERGRLLGSAPYHTFATNHGPRATGWRIWEASSMMQ